MKIGLVQMKMTDDPAENLDRAVAGIRDAARRGAEVVCLPELFRTPYLCQVEDAARFDLAEPVPGPTTESIGRVARDERIAVVASVFERRAPGVHHNTAAVLDADGSLVGIYRKMHIPDDPLYFEKYYFAPGDTGFRAFRTRFGTIGVLVCWDQWFPEAARLTALAGAEVIFYPTAIGWHPREKDESGAAQRDAWRTVQRGHAIANGVWVAAANRVGREWAGGCAGGPAEDGLEFWGSSFVADPQGVVIAEAGAGEEVVVADCDPARIEDVRRNWPFLRDRRIDAYAGIERRLLQT